MDVLTRIRKATRLRHLQLSEKTNKALAQSRYIIIAVFLILSVIFASYAIFGTNLFQAPPPEDLRELKLETSVTSMSLFAWFVQ